jgi:Icc-related predicted phosphoesterase
MKLVVVSDTHGGHDALGVLSGDVLIHCGDGCNGFTREPSDVDRLDDWFARQEFDLILAIGGNHDFEIERRADAGELVFRNARYLQDEAVRHKGVNFYGSPWVPMIRDWAFYGSDSRLARAWDAIPADTDVLVTHTAPAGILDRDRRGRSLGCGLLRKRLASLSPKLHAFGHHHASAGILKIGATTHVNACTVNSRYEPRRPPVVFDLPA